MKINDIDWSKVPDILAKEQVRLLCHCSKRTALYYLKSGKLPCIYSGKKTRCYKIRNEDLMAFIEDRENHPEFYAVPEGWYKESGRTVRQHYSSEIKIDGEDLHEYYRFLLKEYPDVLEVKKVSEITGYAIPVSVSFWLLFPLSLPVQQYPAADSHSEAEQDESEISKDRPWVPGKQADHTPVGSVPAAI